MHAASDLTVAICPRLSAPPLRFKGSRLTRDDTRLADGTCLFVELWQRTSGGYTMAYTAWHEGQWRPHAIRATTLDDAMACLEEACRIEYRSYQPAVGEPVSDLIEQIRQTALWMQDISRFKCLVGHVLDGWFDLAQNPAHRPTRRSA